MNAGIDQNSRQSLTAVSNVDGSTIVTLYADPVNHRLLVDLISGNVTSVSVVSANGFAGSVANATTTPAITLSTTITGILKGNGTAISAASSTTDYVAPGDITTRPFTMTSERLLGRTTATTGAIEEITVGAGLLLQAGYLTATGGGTGTVTSFSAGTLSPLFTTSVATATTTPALSFILSNASANTWFGNATAGSTTPSYNSAGALTKTDDTNVTLTLGGTPTTALLKATSLTLGWTGTLAVSRGGIGAGTLAAHGVLIGNGTSAVSVTSAGTAGQVLTSNGASADPTFQDATAGNMLTSMTAAEDLTAGQTVGVSFGDNDSVARAWRLTTEATLDYNPAANPVKQSSICSIGNDKFVFWNFDTAATDTLYVTVGITDRDNMTWSLGTSVAVTTIFQSTSANSRTSVVKLDTDKFVIFYLDDNSNLVIKYRVGTVSGSTITLGTEATFATGATIVNYVTAATLGTDKGVVVYNCNTSTDSRAIVFTVSGTTITAGTPHTFGTNLSSYLAIITYKIATDKFVIAGSTTDRVDAQICTCSGTTITAGTETSLYTTGAGADDTPYIASPATNVFIFKFITTSPNSTYAIACTVSGTTITVGTPELVEVAGTVLSGGFYIESSSKFSFISDNGNKGIFKFDLSGTTITLIGFADNAEIISGVLVTVDNGYWVNLQNTSGSQNFAVNIQGMANTFMGFAQSTVSRGDPVNVLYHGKDTNQTNLIAGGFYVPDGVGGLVNKIIVDSNPSLLETSSLVKALSYTDVII